MYAGLLPTSWTCPFANLLITTTSYKYTTLYQPCGIGGQRALDCVLCVPPSGAANRLLACRLVSSPRAFPPSSRPSPVLLRKHTPIRGRRSC